jgi:hypothetical protein
MGQMDLNDLEGGGSEGDEEDDEDLPDLEWKLIDLKGSYHH